MAESEGLIKVTLDVPEDSFQRDVMDKLSSLYISEGVSLMCQEWNQIRKQVRHRSGPPLWITPHHAQMASLMPGRDSF